MDWAKPRLLTVLLLKWRSPLYNINIETEHECISDIVVKEQSGSDFHFKILFEQFYRSQFPYIWVL